MKIFIPMLGFGKAGGHRVLSNFATEWQRLGHEVTFLCPKDYHDLYYPTTARIEYVPTLYSILPNRLRKKLVRDFLGLVSLFFALVRRAGQSDLIVANRDLTAFPTRLAALLRRARGVYYIQAYEPDFYEFKNPRLRAVARAISASTYALALLRIVNAPLYKNFEEIRSTHVAPPGVDIATFHPKPPPTTPTRNAQVTLGCIGRAQIWKGTKDVVDAVQMLRDRGHDVRLKVAFHLPQEFAHLDWIEFVQPHGDTNLAAFYRSCDFFIAAGKIQYGAFHYPAAESLAVGTTLVGSPYFPATDANAYLFQECNPHSILDALLRALGDDEAARRERAQTGVRDVAGLSWDRAARNFLEHANAS